MLYFVSISRRNGTKLVNIGSVLVTCMLLIFSNALAATKDVSNNKNNISMVTAHVEGNNLSIVLQGSTEPTYNVFELFKPARIVVDVADATLPENNKLSLPEDMNVSVKTQSITDVQPTLTRFEFTLDHSYAFTTHAENNQIIILVENFEGEGSSSELTSQNLSQEITTGASMPSVESQLPTIDPMEEKAEQTTDNAILSMKNNFNFSGYNKENITVDFYKIDLHNVFRLLRDVSGVNIVVDESVKGSLTLALNDVPWDFALDIILNLKDLKKEERFNTIVIHPKDKEFSWPERAEDNLSFEADEEMVVQESLVIQQRENLPAAIIEAKKIIAQGAKAEKKGDIEEAVKLYETALKKWPDNGKLANKIASLYLVELRQNAKAAFYADKALRIDKNNGGAALNAAIANAKMQDSVTAQHFFDQSVSIGKPSREALLSYAAFSEKHNNFKAAANLLEKHDALYGENLTSMIARARILDKMNEKNAAKEIYRSILLAGFRVPPDLKKYIQNRITIH